MKHIKPGRGPSMQGGIIGIFMICFGIFWTALAGSAFPPFAIFGVLWTGIAVVSTVYNFKNANSKNRYSKWDIVDSDEEPDPLNQRFEADKKDDTESLYCPWCGAKVEGEYKFCNKCGKELP